MIHATDELNLRWRPTLTCSSCTGSTPHALCTSPGTVAYAARRRTPAPKASCSAQQLHANLNGSAVWMDQPAVSALMDLLTSSYARNVSIQFSSCNGASCSLLGCCQCYVILRLLQYAPTCSTLSTPRLRIIQPLSENMGASTAHSICKHLTMQALGAKL